MLPHPINRLRLASGVWMTPTSIITDMNKVPPFVSGTTYIKKGRRPKPTLSVVEIGRAYSSIQPR